MEFRKLKAAAEALKFMPEFNGFAWEDEHHRADYETIEELFASIDRAEACYGKRTVRYEKGENELPIRHLITLSRFYHVSTDYLLGESDDPRRK